VLKRNLSGWHAAALWVSLLALAAALSLQQIYSFDYWWHLRTGALITETASVPEADPYTFTVADARWIDIHWLFQLGLHAIHSLGGHAAVAGAKLVLVFALVGLLASIGGLRSRPAVGVVAIALVLLVTADRFAPRPELPSFVLLAAVLAVLDRQREPAGIGRSPPARRAAGIAAILAIQLLWVNLHGLFALGIAVCAIYLVGELVGGLAGQRPSAPRVRWLAAATALSAAASLANPNFVDGALYPLRQLAMIASPEGSEVFARLSAELRSPLDPRAAANPLATALLVTLGALSLGAMALNGRRLRTSDPLLFAAFLYLALAAQRNAALFAIAAAALLMRNFNDFLDHRPGRIARSPRLHAAGTALVCLVLLALAVDGALGRLLPRLGSYREPGFGVIDVVHPVGAAEWIARERPPGPIAHYQRDGGYLIWRLHPDYRVMLDGRLEVFGPGRLNALRIVGPERFQALDRQYGFGVALLSYTRLARDLIPWLYRQPEWKLVFVDEVAAVFVRAPQGRPSPYAEIDVDAPDLFGPLEGRLGVADFRRRHGRAKFYLAVGRRQRGLAIWQELAEDYPDLLGARSRSPRPRDASRAR
jgi:hypothetical protein